MPHLLVRLAFWTIPAVGLVQLLWLQMRLHQVHICCITPSHTTQKAVIHITQESLSVSSADRGNASTAHLLERVPAAAAPAGNQRAGWAAGRAAGGHAPPPRWRPAGGTPWRPGRSGRPLRAQSPPTHTCGTP